VQPPPVVCTGALVRTLVVVSLVAYLHLRTAHRGPRARVPIAAVIANTAAGNESELSPPSQRWDNATAVCTPARVLLRYDCEPAAASTCFTRHHVRGGFGQSSSSSTAAAVAARKASEPNDGIPRRSVADLSIEQQQQQR
jgi:hypothetical protein